MAEIKKKRPQKITVNYLEKVQEQHRQDRDKWALYIGYVVLVFTKIEDLATDAIELVSPSLHEFGKTLLLEKRLDLLSVVLDSHADLTDDVKTEFCAAIKKVQKLAATRNLIVHNSVKLVLTADSKGVVLSAGGVISSVRNREKKMDLRQLTEFLGQVEGCHLELYNASNKTRKQIRSAQEVRFKRERRRLNAAARRARANSAK